jgi:dGTPase
MDNLYTHVRVTRMGVKAKTIITGLFNTYVEEPRQLPPHIFAHIGRGEATPRVIADYVAGMTDRFALDEYRKLFDPLEKV